MQPPEQIANRLKWAFALTLGIFFVEFIGGILSNSLALLSDAGHLFADVFSLGLALVALYIAGLAPTKRRTYGYHRAEVFAAMINGISLVVIAGVISFEAYHRLLKPEPVKTAAMLIVAAIGLAVNVVVVMRLRHSAGASLNVKSAYLHVVGDMLASVGVIIGALIMIFTGNYLADPIISIIVAMIILRSAYLVIKEGANILLEGVPSGINFEELKRDLVSTPGVLNVHDLHVWTLSSANIMLTLHVVLDEETVHVGREVLEKLQMLCREKYGIYHTTIQVECQCHGCESLTECAANRANHQSRF